MSSRLLSAIMSQRIMIRLDILFVNKGVGVGTRGGLISLSAADYRSRLGSNPSTPTILKKAMKMKNVCGQVQDQVAGQVWGQVRTQVSNQVRNQVRNQVLGQVLGQVSGKVANQVSGQVRESSRGSGPD